MEMSTKTTAASEFEMANAMDANDVVTCSTPPQLQAWQP